ncbi:MAG TPA: nitroreductase family protein [Acidimicrobiales bacterium]
MDVDEALRSTRAVRRRLDLDRPVGRHVVEECLRLALQAPNGSNLQLWRWVVVDDPGVRARMADVYRAAMDEYVASGEVDPAHYTSPEAVRISASVAHLREVLHRVPVLVVPLVTAPLAGASVFVQASLWGSVLPAVWSFMLALRARGLGSAWTTVHLRREREMADVLGVPAGAATQVGLFPVAYTVGTDFRPGPRREPAEVVDWNRWGGGGAAGSGG